MTKTIKPPESSPKILVFDIETAPIKGYFWRLFDENIGTNQVIDDWYVLAWAAKWLDSPPSEVMYQDARAARDPRNDKPLLKGIWELLDQADIVITQNGARFDVKVLNARFAIHEMQPTNPFRHIDVFKVAKKYFRFTSNKLEWLAKVLGVKYQKLPHKKFPGFELWRACMEGNPAAWVEMEAYNRHDVLALEGVYHKLKAWDHSINFDVYHDNTFNHCKCGADDWKKSGFAFTNTGKFQRFKCRVCGYRPQAKENLLSKAKRQTLLK